MTGRQTAPMFDGAAGDEPQSHVGAGITVEHTQRWPGCALPGAYSCSTSSVHVSMPDSASANPSHCTRSSSVRERKPPPAAPTNPGWRSSATSWHRCGLDGDGRSASHNHAEACAHVGPALSICTSSPTSMAHAA